jgi:protein-S-isoprenylcysteine O-methyltransferase Ste14
LSAFAIQAPDALRLAMLLGLVAHKALWEILKRSDRPRRSAPPRVTRSLRIVKTGKMAVLAFLLRLVGAGIFVIGLATAMSARIQLGRNWADIEDTPLRPQQSVVERGIYRYIRHPIYTGDLLLLVGLELGLNSWLVLAVAVLAVVVVRRTLAEEALLARRLPGYRSYCARTRRFIPFIV